MTSAMNIAVFVLFTASTIFAQSSKIIELPNPDTTDGKPLMQALKDRQSTREFSSDSLTIPVLSNLLWAACGVNRAESGKRTAPSAMNWQEIDVYIATAHGLYLYDSAKHTLEQILPDDVREKTGAQAFVKDVPVNLIYVANYSKMSKSSDTDKKPYSFADAAFIGENVYLFCASEGLATVVRGSVDRPALEKSMKIGPEQHVVLVQSVGYPKG
jgi:SagB-type dehydrogenase family enzyme